MKNKTVLIAGSTGLIGQHLVSSAPKDWLVLTPSRDDLNSMFGCYFNPQVDVVIHAAGSAAPEVFQADPIDSIQANTELTIRLMKMLKRTGSFLFCSSTEVYSHGTTTPQHPRGCYIEGKRCGEAIVHAYRSMGADAKSARIALTYGPGTKKHDTRVVNQFIEQALTTGRINLRDSGEATRMFCYVTDMAEMLWNIVLRGTQPVYEVGGPERASINQLAMMIGYLTDAKVSIPVITPSKDAAADVQLNDSYIKEFGREKSTSLRDGLIKTIEYQRSLYQCEK